MVYDGVFWTVPKLHNFFLTDIQVDNIKVNFISPFVAKQNNIQFEYIIRAALRRASTIMKQSKIEFNWNFSQFIQNAKKVKLIHENTKKQQYHDIQIEQESK